MTGMMDVLAHEAPATAGVPEVLERLAALTTSDPVLISLYLRLEVQDRIRRRYHLLVRRLLKQAAADASVPPAARESLHRDLIRIDKHLERPGTLPHCPGLALFACESLGLFEILPLPRVLKTRLLLDQRPRLAEALAAMEGFGRILVAVADRAHARFFEVTAFEVNELSGLCLPARRGGRFHGDRADAPGWGEHNYHDRIRQERHRHAAAVAERLVELADQGPVQGIVLAGPSRSVADQQRFLPRALAGQLLGTVSLNPSSVTPTQVRAAALEIRANWERGHERAVVAEVEQSAGNRWAVRGIADTLEALSRGQVRLLVVAGGARIPGVRCAQSGRLVPAEGSCAGEGEPIPVADVVSAAVDEALQQRVDVEVIDDPDAAARVDGLAALLRFR